MMDQNVWTIGACALGEASAFLTPTVALETVQGQEVISTDRQKESPFRSYVDRELKLTNYGPHSAFVCVTLEPKRSWYSAEVTKAQTIPR